MKRTIIFMLCIVVGVSSTNRTQAQLTVNINIGDQPAWAPEGYDNTPYYYIPDIDMYYDVPAHQFVYLNNRRWVHTATLPSSYRNIDLYRIHKVPINQKNAYRYHNRDKQQYAQFKGKFDQHPIRDSKDNKYAQNRNNWSNNQFRGRQPNGGRNDNNRQGNGHNGHH